MLWMIWRDMSQAMSWGGHAMYLTVEYPVWLQKLWGGCNENHDILHQSMRRSGLGMFRFRLTGRHSDTDHASLED